MIHEDDDDVATLRGIALAVVLGAAIWAVIIYAVWVLWR